MATMIRPLQETVDWPSATTAAAPAHGDLTAVYALAERCCYEADHAHHVADLALTLFDEMTALHDLGEVDRRLLHIACLLHDIGHIAGKRGHHKRSMHLIADETDLPLTDNARSIVACIARYHRKALPKLRHTLYAQLDVDDRHRVRLLAGMLRIADALDKGHIAVVTDLRTALTNRTLLIDCTVRQTELAQSLVLPVTKADLLEQTLNRQIEFTLREE
jgi:exopolyphosphatase/guanosine-5'-triphosphate,3'-diphosphate pyrophosphatase